MNQFFELLSRLTEQVPAGDLLNAVLRYVFPVLALVILGRCARSLLLFHKEAEIWAWLSTRAAARPGASASRASSLFPRASRTSTGWDTI